MAIAESFNGTSTIGTTEWSLTNNSSTIAAQTADGVIQLFLDLNALAAGDVFEVKAYEKILTAGTQRLVWSARFAGAQSIAGWVSPSLVNMMGWDFSLKKIAGTDRSISWSVRSVA